MIENGGAGGTLLVSGNTSVPVSLLVQRQYYKDGEWHDYESQVTLYVSNSDYSNSTAAGGNGGGGPGGCGGGSSGG